MVNTRSTKYNEETTTMDDDRRTVRRQNDDDKRTETRQRGVIRKFASHSKQFEVAAKANGWTSQEMATSLVISLRGQSLEILQSIPEEQQNDYDRIVGALEIRQQRSNESLQEYEADIERLVHLAYPQAPKEFLEQIGIQTFIDGLLDTEMQQALRLGRYTTISDALIAALEFKAAKEASRSYKTRVRQVKFDEFQSLKETRCRETQDAHVWEMSNQHLFVASMMNKSAISRNKNRSICVDVMDRLKEFYVPRLFE
ncbi:hypothetical protein NQ318_017212 [Aromia moschata]|uniref:Retrotransposon gag domain-containing protein n=1 Tax=Aromia moschata TaxID=1265417 RepID=A0AAV8YLT7_9CUCU|nr:hypothetical protein NQ318_017212 [Aromia moschata]